MSITNAVLVTSTPPLDCVLTTVGSSTVLPSLSSPSSEVSVTLLLWPGEEAAPVTILLIDPVLAAF